jgi:hypothetical protein
MEENAVMVEFNRLLSDVEKTFDMIDARDMEPYFERVLDFVLANPQDRDSFETRFISACLPPRGGDDLLKYCMHELRWSGVLAAVREVMTHDPGERLRFWCRYVIDAFEDDWIERDLYTRFRTPRVVH